MAIGTVPRMLPRFTHVPVRWLIHNGGRFVRPLTMGVRAIILDAEGRVFLVRHSYLPGWHFPGGGVEPGETAKQAVTRETSEEARIEILGEPVLHGIFLNRAMANRDHVVVYVVRAFRVLETRPADWEIAEAGFFDLAALPDQTTTATRARLREVLGGVPLSDLW